MTRTYVQQDLTNVSGWVFAAAAPPDGAPKSACLHEAVGRHLTSSTLRSARWRQSSTSYQGLPKTGGGTRGSSANEINHSAVVVDAPQVLQTVRDKLLKQGGGGVNARPGDWRLAKTRDASVGEALTSSAESKPVHGSRADLYSTTKHVGLNLCILVRIERHSQYYISTPPPPRSRPSSLPPSLIFYFFAAGGFSRETASCLGCRPLRPRATKTKKGQQQQHQGARRHRKG